MKIGRNQPCPCGSGQKYKRCCGDPLKESTTSRSPYPRPIPPEASAMLERHKAAEFVREQQQGLGRPIMSMKLGEQQIVGVGDTLYSSPIWKTMADFLMHYIKTVLDGDWGNTEIAKPFADRHPIMQWYHEYCMFQQKHMGLGKPGEPGEVKESPMTGVAYCFLGLAYGLFLLKNNVELQDRLIKRLKDPKQFQGAYYEVMIANNLIRAGFELTLEDETDESTKHCEFAAVSKKTGKKYWIEAKMRSVDGVMGKTRLDGASATADPTGRITHHVNEALKKPADDERMIFVDVNTPPSAPGVVPPWTVRAGKRLDAKERDLRPGQSAYVFVTNMSFHHVLQSDQRVHTLMGFGLGIPDFGKEGNIRVSTAYRGRIKHADAYAVIEAFTKYPQIPATFDGSLPSSLYGKSYDRIILGETYHFTDIGENGVVGTVTSAIVDEPGKQMVLAITDGESSHILTQPMSDEALRDYKEHPETFFGVIQHVGKKTENPYELFLFFLDSYKNSSKEKLLEFMRGAPDMAILQEMSQEDLAIEYSERLTGMAVNRAEKTG